MQERQRKGRAVSSTELVPPELDELPQFKEEMKHGWLELQTFVASLPFKELLSELDGKDEPEQREFVAEVLLNREELAKRHVKLPPGIIIQTSEFEALGPDLFVVKKFVRPGINVNVTFFTEMFTPAAPQ